MAVVDSELIIKNEIRHAAKEVSFPAEHEGESLGLLISASLWGCVGSYQWPSIIPTSGVGGCVLSFRNNSKISLARIRGPCRSSIEDRHGGYDLVYEQKSEASDISRIPEKS